MSYRRASGEGVRRHGLPVGGGAGRPERAAEEGKAVVPMQRLQAGHQDAQHHPAEALRRQRRRRQVPEQHRPGRAEPLRQLGRPFRGAWPFASRPGVVKGRAGPFRRVQAVVDGVSGEVGGRAFRRGRLGGARGRVVWEGMRRLLGSKDILAALGGPERFFAGEQRAALAAGDDPAGDRLREEALKLIRRWRTNIGTWIKVNTGQRTW